MSTLACLSRRWPSSPTSFSVMCRLYLTSSADSSSGSASLEGSGRSAGLDVARDMRRCRGERAPGAPIYSLAPPAVCESLRGQLVRCVVRDGLAARLGGHLVGEREWDLAVRAVALEPFRERAHGGNIDRRSASLGQSFGHESREHERYGFARRANELTEQLVLRRAECDTAVVRGEHPRLREPHERGDQPLLDTQRRELAELLEERGSLVDHLSDERERLLRLLAYELAEAGAAEMQCVGLLVGAGVRRVLRIDAEPFPSEGLASARECRDEGSSGFPPTA